MAQGSSTPETAPTVALPSGLTARVGGTSNNGNTVVLCLDENTALLLALVINELRELNENFIKAFNKEIRR